MSAERAIGLGCMRLPDEARAVEVIRAGLDAGVSWLDTARAYPDNERWVARALEGRAATVVTKGGMRRPRGNWVPDGKRKRLLEDAERSREALGVDALDLFLIHAPDPSTPWKTSVRALAHLRKTGVAKAVGLSNVSRAQLDEALAHVDVAAVELALSPLDDAAVRGGVVERCLELGIRVIAHSPLGGPRKVASLLRREPLAKLAAARGVSAGTLALAWLYGLHEGIVPIPGAGRPESARAAAEAASLQLTDEEREALDAAFPLAHLIRTPRASRRPAAPKADVVLLMGIPAAGKSTRARALEAEGFERLNRDEAGGTLAKLARTLDARLAEGAPRVVMDNTYPTRAQRNRVIETAWARGASVRCVWLETPLHEAQVNAVDRMLGKHGHLPTPEELKELGKHDPNTFPPRAQFRFRETLEPPALDEGFESIERVEHTRRPQPGHERAGRVLDLARLEAEPSLLDSEAPILVLAWSPGATDAEVEALEARWPDVSVGVCAHPAGPPRCWCRKPLPGLVVAWMRAHRIDPRQSRYFGSGSADRTLAERLGMAYDQYLATGISTD